MTIGILGYGTVASAVVKSLLTNYEFINEQSNCVLKIKKIATRSVKKVNLSNDEIIITSELEEIINDDDIDVVIELIGGIEVAKEYIIKALKNKKYVITANKALLALHGKEIFNIANENNVEVLFEGAVAVSIPIIKVLKESFNANKIDTIYGILNGTSNYVLTCMENRNLEFDEAITEAKNKGFAESDPILDINGTDAGHKITILSSIVNKSYFDFSVVKIKGIENVQLKDINFIKELGFVLKQIAYFKRIKGKLLMGVESTLIDKSNLLFSVKDSMNGIVLRGNLFGESFFYGSGAGGKETSSAILSDLINLSYIYDKSCIKKIEYKNEIISNNIKKFDIYERFYVRIKIKYKDRNKLDKFMKYGEHNITIIKSEKYCDLLDLIFIDNKNIIYKLKKIDYIEEIVYYPIL